MVVIPPAAWRLQTHGNINGNPKTDDFLLANPGYVYLDANNTTDGAVNGAIIQPATNGGTSGTWSLNAALLGGYTNFALGLKDGNFNPDWAVFLLGGNWNLGGLWAFVNAQTGGTLSHAILYGQVAPVPVPAALVLFLSGLLGLFGLSLRRRRATAATA